MPTFKLAIRLFSLHVDLQKLKLTIFINPRGTALPTEIDTC